MGCSIFKELYDTLAKGAPLTLEGIGNRALHNLHVSVGAKAGFVRSFVDSAEAVGLLTRLDAERIELKVRLEDASVSSHEPTAATATASPATLGPNDQTTATSLRPTIDQTWKISGGNVSFTIITSKPLAASSFTQLGTIMTAIETLAKSLQEEDSDE